MAKGANPLFAEQQEQGDAGFVEKLCADAKNCTHLPTRINMYKHAIKSKPDYYPAYLAKAMTESEMGEHEQALKTLEELLTFNKEYAPAYVFMGFCKSAMGDKMGCIQMCEKAIEIQPNLAEAHNVLGETYMEIGKLQDALNSYEKTLEIEPRHLFAHGNKGYVLYLQGKYNEALECYKTHLEISPKDFTVFIKQGKALQGSGKAKEALESYSKATDLILEGRLNGTIWRFQSFEIKLNQHEIQLIHCLQDLLSLPEIGGIQLEDQVKDLALKKDVLKMKILDGFGIKKKTEDNTIEELKKEIEKLKLQTAQLEADIRDAGVKDLAIVKRGFKELEEKDPELLSYCKTFYWTSINLFGAYRAASTGLLEGDHTHDESVKDSILCEGIKKATGVVADISKGVPFVGGFISMIDSVIDDIIGVVKENKYMNKVNAINKIIQNKVGTEDDISVNVAKVALSITHAKEQNILYPELSKKPGKLEKGYKWLSEKIENLKEKVLPSIDLHNKNSHGASLALEDVALMMAYLTKNSDAVVARKDPLDKQLESIVKFGGLDQLLEDKDHIDGEKKPGKARGCCTIF